MPMPTDTLRGWRTRLWGARDPALLMAAFGAILLTCAPVLPGLTRLIVLPALLLSPGYALLRVLGQATGLRCLSIAVPLSLVLTVCASLLLDVGGVRLDAASLGIVLGAVTAVFLAWSYGRQLATNPLQQHQTTLPGDADLARPEEAR
jgi:hypothetical protein